MGEKIKIFIAEKQRIIREGLMQLLAGEDILQLHGQSGDAPGIPDQIVGTDVLLIELTEELPEFLNLVEQVRRKNTKVKIIVLSAKDDDLPMLQALLETGIVGYLTKNASKEELFHSIRKVMDDGIYICTAFSMRLLKNTTSRSSSRDHRTSEKLSEAEQEVLNLIADGLTNKEIADKLSASVRTIESRRRHLLEKTGTVNTATLIRKAVQTGLID